MIRLANFCLIFAILIAEYLKKIYFNFGHNIEDLKKQPLYHKLITIFSENRTLRIINFFFHNKIFDCFVCCSLIKKIHYNNTNYEFLIGARYEKNKNLKSHAWIIYKNKVIFPIVNDLKEYKVLLEIK